MKKERKQKKERNERKGERTNLSTSLLSDEDDIPRRVVDGDVGDEETATRQCLQAVDQRRSQEQQTVRLVAVEHLSFEFQPLHPSNR